MNDSSSTLFSKNIRKHIHTVLTKKYGFTLQLEAVKFLEQVFVDYQIQPNDWMSTLELIAQAYRNQEGHRLPIISKDDIQLIITRLEHHSSTPSSTPYATQGSNYGEEFVSTTLDLDEVHLPQLLHVIQAFKQPKLKYQTDTKTFQKIDQSNLSNTTAISKAMIYRERYDLIKQRILRNQNFRPSSTFYSSQNDRFFILTSISSLRGRTNDSFVLFGMLCKYEDEKLYLEDPTGHVELDISKAARSRGFFTETSFVVLDGIYTEDQKFLVKAMAMPPAESRLNTIEVFGQPDLLGATQHEIYDGNQLKKIEEKYDGINLVFLSNVYLDVPQVITALRKLLTGCEDALTPLAMIFCGNFTSRTVSMSEYQHCWTKFADLLSSFTLLSKHTTFIFVPGPKDPFMDPSLLPKPALPEIFVQKMKRKLTHVHFATNPCRFTYCSQEIVLFRENLVNKMYRNTLAVGESRHASQGLPYHLARTLIDQAHLCPLPLHLSPVLWDYDYTLRLYPLPTLLVVADMVEKFHEVYEQVHIVNPGSFSASNGFGFLVYYPKDQKIEMRYYYYLVLLTLFTDSIQ